jgi:hypothetical protein
MPLSQLSNSNCVRPVVSTSLAKAKTISLTLPFVEQAISLKTLGGFLVIRDLPPAVELWFSWNTRQPNCSGGRRQR